MHLFSVWFLYFIIYAILGWIAETIYCSVLERHFVERGFLRGPLCPIYGCGALLILWALLPYVKHWLLLFAIGFLLTSVLEYITSFVMEKIFRMRWWDYSDHFLNINGRVCLLNSTLFGLLTLILAKVLHPLVEKLVGALPEHLLYALTVVVGIAFLADLITSVKATLRLKATLEKFREVQERFKEDFDQYQQGLQERLAEKKDDLLEQLNEGKENIKETLESLDTKREELLAESKQRLYELRLRLGGSERYILRSFPDLKPTKLNLVTPLAQLKDELKKARENRRLK